MGNIEIYISAVNIYHQPKNKLHNVQIVLFWHIGSNLFCRVQVTSQENGEIAVRNIYIYFTYSCNYIPVLVISGVSTTLK